MTAATDGYLAFWQDSRYSDIEGPQQLICLTTQSLHQSSIKSLSSCSLNDNKSLVVTGGDDNGIGLALVTCNGLGEVQCNSLIIPRAHAAAVTATAILTCRRSRTSPSCFRVQIATASNDQRIKLWAINIELGKNGVEGMEVKRTASKYTAVADVSSMALYPHGNESEPASVKILICGVGMEVWEAEVR
jgi:WD40 repeat protein